MQMPICLLTLGLSTKTLLKLGAHANWKNQRIRKFSVHVNLHVTFLFSAYSIRATTKVTERFLGFLVSMLDE